jgi:hypothetical protein
MLMNLLPGLRELRAPLASGYLWLISVWLLLSDMGWLPSKRPPGNGVAARLWDLGGLVGATVVLAVFTFVAYLIGSFLEMDPDGRLAARLKPLVLADRRPGYLRNQGPQRSIWFQEASRSLQFRGLVFSGSMADAVVRSISPEAKRDLRDILHQRGKLKDLELDELMTPPNGKTDPVSRYKLAAAYEMATDVIIFQVVQEIQQLASRLLVKNKDLYGKYDRLMAEASVRMNVSIPLTLMLSLAIWLSGLALWLRLALTVVAIGFGYMLLRQGFLRAMSARDVVVQALTIGEVQSRYVPSEEVDEASKSPDKEPVRFKEPMQDQSEDRPSAQ